MFNQNHCSPKKSKRSKSCLDIKLLVKIAKILNKYKNANINYKNKKTLHKNIQNYISKISNCNSEHCWITISEIINNLNQKEIRNFKKSFKPFMPEKWKSNPIEWLTTSDINKVLEQYQELHPDFKYFGAIPIDFSNCSVSSELCNLSLQHDLLNKGKKKAGIVFNTDPSHKSGQHWISMFIDLKGENQNHPHIYFFDSVAKKPPQEVEDFIKKMINESKEINNELKFAYNNIVHQQENTECGIYSIYFISEMLKGRKFHELINKIKRDSYMKKLRKFFFIE